MADSLAIVESHKSNNAEHKVHLGLAGVSGPRTNSKRSKLVDLFYATFLPVGYPGTVRKGYVRYQLWDLFQGLCTYLRMTLAVKALLEGLGVGDAEASVIGGSLLWVAKDGTQMLASLVFSYFSATEMGLSVRQWRLFADVANDIGLTLNVSAPLFGPWFLLVTCLGSAFMAVTGVCAHATKTSISEHFALASLSDCVTKEGTQETGVQLIGLVGGAFIVKWLGDQKEDDKIVRLWSVFTVLTVLHMYANMRAVATLRFHYVNEIRFRLLFDAFRRGTDMGIEHIAVAEPRLPVLPWKRKRVLMGERLSALGGAVRPEAFQTTISAARAEGAQFAIVHGSDLIAHIVLHRDIEPFEMLRARFLAECEVLKSDKSVGVEDDLHLEWEPFLDALERNGWKTDVCLLSSDLWRYDWMDGLESRMAGLKS